MTPTNLRILTSDRRRVARPVPVAEESADYGRLGRAVAQRVRGLADMRDDEAVAATLLAALEDEGVVDLSRPEDRMRIRRVLDRLPGRTAKRLHARPLAVQARDIVQAMGVDGTNPEMPPLTAYSGRSAISATERINPGSRGPRGPRHFQD